MLGAEYNDLRKKHTALKEAKMQFETMVKAMITAQVKHTDFGGTELYLQKLEAEKAVMDYLKIDKNLMV